jgi:hypothetical protein
MSVLVSFAHKTQIVNCPTADSKPVKQEVNSTVESPFSVPCMLFLGLLCVQRQILDLAESTLFAYINRLL